MRGALLALVVGWTAAVHAGELPVVREIVFEGNDTTRPHVMLREMVLKVGDPADPARIERSRQGIQDLGLFRSVDVTQAPVPGGVRLVFRVKEKWYLLPIPRYDANSEGENAYGVSLRWYNVDGRNHTLRGNWTQRDEKKLNQGESTRYSLSYAMPFLFETPYSLSLFGGHSKTPITDFDGYDEVHNSIGLAVGRSFATGPASQGLNAAVSLAHNRQKTLGANAPPPYGHATILGMTVSYRDLRDHRFSDEGLIWHVGVQGASEDVYSEYSFGSISGRLKRYTLVGHHRNLNFATAIGSYHGGPTEHKTYEGIYALGGASTLRAYPADFVIGDFFYHVEAEYLRPVVADWLRFVVVAEAGNAFSDASEIEDRVYASLGVGLRLRLTFLVSFEVEAGVAWPLEGGDSRAFASKV